MRSKSIDTAAHIFACVSVAFLIGIGAFIYRSSCEAASRNAEKHASAPSYRIAEPNTTFDPNRPIPRTEPDTKPHPLQGDDLRAQLDAAHDVVKQAAAERERWKHPTPEMARRATEEAAARLERAMTSPSTGQDSYPLNRANDYGNGAGVPISPETQDVRQRFGADGRYARPQPSQRTYEHR